MNNNSFILLYKFRFLIGSILVTGCLLLLSFLLSVISSDYKVHAANIDPNASYASTGANDDANVVTNLMSSAGNKSLVAISSAEKGLNSGLQIASKYAVAVPVRSIKWLGSGMYTSVNFAADVTGNTFGFISHIPGKALRLASPSNIVSSTIKPADQTSVPVIDSVKLPIPRKSIVNPSPQKSPTTADYSADPSVQWPIHGTITTSFGVPEWPYQPIHTGIDISDGNRSGTTSIKPFKAGRVVQTIRSGAGLGNHVIIDHGGGITSVYGHLYSISVTVGQAVDKNTIIGHEGSTGVSTGTHLHFEVRINGRPVNPMQFIPGRP